MWCNPNGIRDLSITPNIKVDTFVFVSLARYDSFANPIWTGCHITGIANPIINAATAVTIGTNLFPAKNPKNAGSSVL